MGEFLASMAGIHIPQGRHAVDVFLAVRGTQGGAVPLGKDAGGYMLIRMMQGMHKAAAIEIEQQLGRRSHFIHGATSVMLIRPPQ